MQENIIEKTEVGYFDDMVELFDGIRVRKHMRWSEIDEAARHLAFMQLIADEEKSTLVLNWETPVGAVFCFLKYCTDVDMEQFNFPAPDDGGEADIDIGRMMDFAIEKGILNGYCQLADKALDTAWLMISNVARDYAQIMYEQHRQEMDIGRRLVMAFGDILDGSTGDIVRQASGLGEELIDLIGKAKAANAPQGGILNFAKKKE